MTDLPHTGCGPRIQDFRHGFAVENLCRWSAEGKDLLKLISSLFAYMGHSDHKTTQYYLHLTSEIYPERVEMLAAEYMDIVPQGGTMNIHDLSYHVSQFFNSYLSGRKNVSKHTIVSYTTRFKQFLIFCEEVRLIKQGRLALSLIDEALITAFLTSWRKLAAQV